MAIINRHSLFTYICLTCFLIFFCFILFISYTHRRTNNARRMEMRGNVRTKNGPNLLTLKTYTSLLKNLSYLDIFENHVLFKLLLLLLLFVTTCINIPIKYDCFWFKYNYRAVFCVRVLRIWCTIKWLRAQRPHLRCTTLMARFLYHKV